VLYTHSHLVVGNGKWLSLRNSLKANYDISTHLTQLILIRQSYRPTHTPTYPPNGKEAASKTAASFILGKLAPQPKMTITTSEMKEAAICGGFSANCLFDSGGEKATGLEFDAPLSRAAR
jgi:hypothetical protein